MSDASYFEQCKASFDRAVAAYEAHRPGYPPEIFQILQNYLNTPTVEVLEIGCGTGQSTEHLLAQNYRVHALDLAPKMIARIQQKYGDNPRFSCESGKFEDFHSSPTFNLIYSSQAKHWIAPEVLYPHAAALLAPKGAIAWVRNQPHYPNQALRQELDAIYQEHFPKFARRKLTDPDPADLEARIRAEIEASGLFTEIAIHHGFEHRKRFDSDSYIGLMQSQSDHIVAGAQIEVLYRGIQRCIERHGGEIELRYETWLSLARKP